MEPDDAELTARIACGDAAAFQTLYERHWHAVYRFAWLLTSCIADAEDITQECFLALVRKTAAFDPSRAQLRTWLIAVARRQYLWRIRSSAREISREDQEQSHAAGFDEDLLRMERAEAVQQAIAALPQMQREALYLFEFEELSLAEVAGILNIEVNAVKARLYRARERLKRLLEHLRNSKSETKGSI